MGTQEDRCIRPAFPQGQPPGSARTVLPDPLDRASRSARLGRQFVTPANRWSRPEDVFVRLQVVRDLSRDEGSAETRGQESPSADSRV